MHIAVRSEFVGKYVLGAPLLADFAQKWGFYSAHDQPSYSPVFHKVGTASPLITENSVRTHELSDWKPDRGSRPA
jgi:hypothetical protein